MHITLCAFNEMFPNEVAARAFFGKTGWPNGPACCPLRDGWQYRLHGKNEVLALQGVR